MIQSKSEGYIEVNLGHRGVDAILVFNPDGSLNTICEPSTSSNNTIYQLATNDSSEIKQASNDVNDATSI